MKGRKYTPKDSKLIINGKALSTIDTFYLQTRIRYCQTVNCANRKFGETECNMKEIGIKDGKCGSLIKVERDDIRLVK